MCDLKDLVLKLIPEYMGGEIEKACAASSRCEPSCARSRSSRSRSSISWSWKLHSGEGAEIPATRPRATQSRRTAEKDITQAASGGRTDRRESAVFRGVVSR